MGRSRSFPLLRGENTRYKKCRKKEFWQEKEISMHDLRDEVTHQSTEGNAVVWMFLRNHVTTLLRFRAWEMVVTLHFGNRQFNAMRRFDVSRNSLDACWIMDTCRRETTCEIIPCVRDCPLQDVQRQEE